jgi:hypothetical protein
MLASSERSKPYQRNPQEVHGAMKDYLASIEKLRKDAAEAALIRDLATDAKKRALYQKLHEHLLRLADEVELAINASDASKMA